MAEILYARNDVGDDMLNNNQSDDDDEYDTADDGDDDGDDDGIQENKSINGYNLTISQNSITLGLVTIKLPYIQSKTGVENNGVINGNHQGMLMVKHREFWKNLTGPNLNDDENPGLLYYRIANPIHGMRFKTVEKQKRYILKTFLFKTTFILYILMGYIQSTNNRRISADVQPGYEDILIGDNLFEPEKIVEIIIQLFYLIKHLKSRHGLYADMTPEIINESSINIQKQFASKFKNINDSVEEWRKKIESITKTENDTVNMETIGRMLERELQILNLESRDLKIKIRNAFIQKDKFIALKNQVQELKKENNQLRRHLTRMYNQTQTLSAEQRLNRAHIDMLIEAKMREQMPNVELASRIAGHLGLKDIDKLLEERLISIFKLQAYNSSRLVGKDSCFVRRLTLLNIPLRDRDANYERTRNENNTKETLAVAHHLETCGEIYVTDKNNPFGTSKSVISSRFYGCYDDALKFVGVVLTNAWNNDQDAGFSQFRGDFHRRRQNEPIWTTVPHISANIVYDKTLIGPFAKLIAAHSILNIGINQQIYTSNSAQTSMAISVIGAQNAIKEALVLMGFDVDLGPHSLQQNKSSSKRPKNRYIQTGRTNPQILDDLNRNIQQLQQLQQRQQRQERQER